MALVLRLAPGDASVGVHCAMRAGRRELPAHIFQRSENSSSAVEQRHSGVIVHEIDSLEDQALATVFLLHRGGHVTERARKRDENCFDNGWYRADTAQPYIYIYIYIYINKYI